MKELKYLLVLGLMTLPVIAEDKKYEKLLDYEGVTIKKIEKDGIRIIHSHGVAKIPIEKLPDEVREELGISKDAVQENREQVASAKVELGDYTDKKLNDAFTSFAKEKKTTPILILVANGKAGKAKFTQKCVYDREKKILFILKRADYQTIPNPTTSYSWVVWRGIEPDDLSEGLPWLSERLTAELSNPTDDGRTNFPIQYLNDTTITQWP